MNNKGLLVPVLLCLLLGGIGVRAKEGLATAGAPVPLVETNRPLQVGSTDDAITVDGVLDEAFWLRALIIPFANEYTPGDNVPAPVRTEVRVVAGPSALYVAFVAQDPWVNQLRAHLYDRDQCEGDDMVGLLLDTFDDQSRAYGFYVNPLGVQLDLVRTRQVSLGRLGDLSWDGIWDAAGRVDGNGYTVEMAIPFNTLQFQRQNGSQVWGFMPVRIYPRSRRHEISAMRVDRNNACLLCQFPRLEGFGAIRPGRNLEVDPTLTGVLAREREELGLPLERSARRLDPGISGHWGLTPNWVLAGAVNPDFSQVEADSARLTINNPFAQYYDEKRPFFLEGADYFDTPMNVVYTRQISDPDWGAKITGKEGDHTMGFIVARDHRTQVLIPGPDGSWGDGLERSNTAMLGRYRLDLGGASTLGLLVTSREGGG